MRHRVTGVLLGILLLLVVPSARAQTPPPEPYGALPDPRHLAWHEMEFYGFLHFTTNTFTGKEWGYGDESPEIFNPSEFDADQIVGVAADAGMTGLILTCKHHDGFCLWPSEYTDHDVASSPFRDGEGDVVREIADACARHGLRFGVYLSPWDRNHPDYGTPAYVEYYRNQLRELLTGYGEIFEVWWDGANGGDGYYGGARESRKIDRSTYYGWEETVAIVRELQPDAVIFSDAGDVRWVGNERGVAGDPCWAT
ncbi:MAG: alpha-L-fucosidase, partial [Phycisphaerales bacterium JB041]